MVGIFTILVSLLVMTGITIQVLIQYKHIIEHRLNRQKALALINIGEIYFPRYRDISRVGQVSPLLHNIQVYVAPEIWEDPCYPRRNTSFVVQARDGRTFRDVALVIVYSDDTVNSGIFPTNYLNLQLVNGAAYIVNVRRYKSTAQFRFCYQYNHYMQF